MTNIYANEVDIDWLELCLVACYGHYLNQYWLIGTIANEIIIM